MQPTLADAKSHIADRSNTEIAFFGGSFTALPEDTMRKYLEAAKPFLGKDGFAGIRISTRPDAVSSGILSWLKQYGVSAVEFGAQSMKNDVLKRNGRGHTAEDVEHASHLVKEAGLSLGLQMMVGLPGDTKPSDAWFTAKRLLAFTPDTMRIYPAVILPHTKLAVWYQSGEYVPMDFDTAVSVCAGLLWLFHQNGIPVIRLGLHDSPEVAVQHVGGIYHPAFRELCENALYLGRAEKALLGKAYGHYIAEVGPGCISKMVGQNRKNLLDLEQKGYYLHVRENPGLKKYEIMMKGGEK